MNFKNKSDWNLELSYASEEELASDIVAYIKPLGHLYLVKREGDNTILSSKDREHYNDPISKELVSLGYEGVISIEFIDNSERPKSWLNQYLDSFENMAESTIRLYTNKIRIHVFDECKPSNIYNIQRTMGSKVEMDRVKEFNITRGSSNNCDGVIFKYKGEWYQILPRRTVVGVIRSVIGEEVVVLVPYEGAFRPILARWSGETDPNEFIGNRARVKYTKNLSSDHINPILSPVIYEEKVCH